MLSLSHFLALSQKYQVPLEDVTLIALNTNGVSTQCDYDRARMALHLEETKFAYAKKRGELDYYLALPIKANSPFSIKNGVLFLDNQIIGTISGMTEDICNSHYFRRNMTSLNINANRRTKCHGCEFCYAIYQVPNDGKRLISEDDFREFFSQQCQQYNLKDLSSLIQLSIVTGCYRDGDDLCDVLERLRKVASEEFGFSGKIFYLGSQITEKRHLERLAKIKPFHLCFSIEAFERRDLLRGIKANLSIQQISRLMEMARAQDIEVSFAYVLGLEPLDVVERYFNAFKRSIDAFPTVNLLQVHNRQSDLLYADGAKDLEFYLKAREIIETAFKSSNLRPIPWSDYRSPWYLRFGDEEITGPRMPGI